MGRLGDGPEGEGRGAEQVAAQRGRTTRTGRGWRREGSEHGKGCFRVSLWPRKTPLLGVLSCGSPAHSRVARTRAPDSWRINPRKA